MLIRPNIDDLSRKINLNAHAKLIYIILNILKINKNKK